MVADLSPAALNLDYKIAIKLKIRIEFMWLEIFSGREGDSYMDFWIWKRIDMIFVTGDLLISLSVWLQYLKMLVLLVKYATNQQTRNNIMHVLHFCYSLSFLLFTHKGLFVVFYASVLSFSWGESKKPL